MSSKGDIGTENLNLLNSPFFTGMSELGIKVLSAYLKSRKLKKGETVFNEGDLGESMFIFVSGKLSAFVSQSDGTEHWIFDVKQGDILNYSIPGYINKIVANLPYYATTPIIMHLLENYSFESVTVMVQKEVAQRIAAGPGSKSYGALTLAVQYYARASIAANVPPNCFMPRPGVASCVIHLEILDKPPVKADKPALFANIRAGFGQRRKTLVNSLYAAELTPLTKEEIASAIVSCGFSENIRGEELTLEDWARLTEVLV